MVRTFPGLADQDMIRNVLLLRLNVRDHKYSDAHFRGYLKTSLKRSHESLRLSCKELVPQDIRVLDNHPLILTLHG